MKYLCLIYIEEAKMESMSEQDLNELFDETGLFEKDLTERGNLLACSPLQSVRTATTIRVRNGMMAITDGPFAETKEQLGGYFLLDARDLNEAIRLAAKFPPGRFGSVEVRPLREYTNGTS
jgi:hypothetical protein